MRNSDDCWLPDAFPCVAWGTVTLDGPDGGWNGSFQGTDLADRTVTHHVVMTGSGEYEGLTFVWHRSGGWYAPTGHGLICEGVPPPMPVLTTPTE